MPRRDDLHTIMLIGSGPIIIGQGCEFDYSGTQACKALREENYRIVLINSNPATIMTDPEFADRTYIEPITPEAVGKIIEAESKGPHRIDALLPTLGGQTGLNTAVAVADSGVLDRFGVEMIGATREVIHRAEDRTEFKNICLAIGLDVPRSGIAHNMEQARQVMAEVGLPVCIRPAYTLGGTGGGFAFNKEEFEVIAARGLEYSPISEVLIEESVLGWKEYELEVMRDKKDNVVIVCSIENFDPMGVHTGDSITVAPAQTLTDKEYQLMRDAAIAIIRAIGVETGGSNIQFAVDPDTGRMIVVEMNPRVSRSSALASKATGFPIAKIAAKLAVGYTLDELPNDITRVTPACFEPTIDYCVVKIPRWTFEKFPDADETLTTQMKSVGEAMSIGRTFKEAFQKGIRSMEVKRFGLGLDGVDKWLRAQRESRVPCPSPRGHVGGKPTDSHARADLGMAPEKAPSAPVTSAGSVLEDMAFPIEIGKLRRKLAVPSQGRIYYIRYALKMGWTIEQIYELTKIDKWFLANMKQLVDFEEELWAVCNDPLLVEYLNRIKALQEWESKTVARILERKKLGELPKEENENKIPPDSKDDSDLKGVVDLYSKWNKSDLIVGLVRRAKQLGYSDVQLATTWNTTEQHIRAYRRFHHIEPVYKLVDTCAAEFEAYTPYYYSTYETPIRVVNPDSRTPNPAVKSSIVNRQSSIVDDEVRVTDKKKIIILGGGPNRIGQGIEFDYCCVHAAFAARELGFEAVMVNSNPETVSTDYDTSDMLFFEPLTLEDTLNICERLNGQPLKDLTAENAKNAEKSENKNKDISSSAFSATSAVKSGLLYGVIVQFGGQTPLNLAKGLHDAGVPIIGTSVDSIDMAEDRKRFAAVLDELNLKSPKSGTATTIEGAREVAQRIGYPVLVRPSYVLGGRAMEIVSDQQQLDVYMARAVDASTVGSDHPILIDRFLDNATEVDVDCISDFGPRVDGTAETKPRAVICGVMEHIEEAGIHSGDSACSLPPFSLPAKVVAEIERQTRRMAERLQVRGLMNVQFAVKDGEVYILEVNPRASRTVPFVSKATGVSWAKLAAKVMAGKSLAELGVTEAPRPKHISVKESVFPFTKFPGVDVILGPEMRSTGEVMGVDMSFGIAFAKSQMGAGVKLPTSGTLFISVNDADKPKLPKIVKRLGAMGFDLAATGGTADVIEKAGVHCRRISKLDEGRPNIRDMVTNGECKLIFNTPTARGPATDEGKIRALATIHNIPLVTTMTGAEAVTRAIEALRHDSEGKDSTIDAWTVRPLQEYFPNKA